MPNPTQFDIEAREILESVIYSPLKDSRTYLTKDKALAKLHDLHIQGQIDAIDNILIMGSDYEAYGHKMDYKAALISERSDLEAQLNRKDK